MARAVTDIRALARTHTRLAITTLAAICRSKGAPAAARVGASVALLERGWGKPQQNVEVDAQITVTVRKMIDDGQNIVLDLKAEPLALEDESDDEDSTS